MVVGAGEAGAMVIKELQDHPEIKMKPVVVVMMILLSISPGLKVYVFWGSKCYTCLGKGDED